jgi:hypothetical protein
MEPYDKWFTNTFWTETLVVGPYDKGFYKYLVDTYNCHGTVWQGFTNTLWVYDPFLVNVYYNGTTNTMKRHKVCQGSTSTLYMFVWWCSRHFQQYFSSIGRSGIIGGGNRFPIKNKLDFYDILRSSLSLRDQPLALSQIIHIFAKEYRNEERN